MAALVEVDVNVYVNPDQVQLVRPATPSEAKDRQLPLAVIILQNDQRYYVKGYVPEIAHRINKEKAIEATQ
jgi:hypothetical protein